MSSYEHHWAKLLGSTADAGDIVASLREDAVNHYLQEHFKLDNRRYSVTRTFKASVDVGGTAKEMPLTLTIAAKSPIQIDFSKFSPGPGGNGASWVEFEAVDPAPGLSSDNVRVSVAQVAFTLTWESVYSPGKKYSWTPSPIALEAEGRMELRSVHEPIEESRHTLIVRLTRARFGRPARIVLEKELAELLARLPESDKALVAEHAVDKFDELLVIALNTAAIEAAPKFVASIEVPVMTVAQQRLVPRGFWVDDDIATASFGLDDAHLARTATDAFAKSLAEFDVALDQDIESAGGLRQLLFEDAQSVDWDDLDSIRAAKVRSESDIAARLSSVNALSTDREQRAGHALSEADRVVLAGPSAGATGGAAVCFNEYLLDALLATLARLDPPKCTNWLDLKAVRGRACYWTRLFNPDGGIAGNAGKLEVSGAIDVDVGGKLEACIRKFWDCSWKWECSDIRLAVVGRPRIQFTLVHHKYVALSAKITGKLTLESNLPFPFNKVVSALATLIWEGIKVVLNAVLSAIQIVLVPPKISIPKQQTAVALSDFRPRYFPYDGGTTSKSRYAAVEATVSAVKD